MLDSYFGGQKMPDDKERQPKPPVKSTDVERRPSERPEPRPLRESDAGQRTNTDDSREGNGGDHTTKEHE
jgi:hypothetical protein